MAPLDDPFARAAARMRRGVVSPQRAQTTIDQTLAELLVPQNAAEAAMYALPGGVATGIGRKIGTRGIGALMGLVGAGSYSNTAEAGPLERLTRAAVNIGGKIYAGPNHATAIRIAEQTTGKDFDELIGLINPTDPIDGFLTSTGRFVNRKEAAAIAEQAQQLRRPERGYGDLLTEEVRHGAIWGLPALMGAGIANDVDAKELAMRLRPANGR